MRTTPQIVIVADDLTGAMDSAAPFAKRGLDVRVLAAPDKLDLLQGSYPQVLSINTGSRHLAGEQAGALVGEVVRNVMPLSPKLLFKKIDSTLRGNLIPETLAAMHASDCDEMLVCPAVPAQGRTVSGGEVFVNGAPLGETAAGRDQRSRPPCLSLPQLYRDALRHSPGQVVVSPSWDAAGDSARHPRVSLVDADSPEQLLDMAGRASRSGRKVLFVGAAGLAEALAETLFGPALPASPPAGPRGNVLFAVGSRTPEAAMQLNALLAAEPGATLIELSADLSMDDTASMTMTGAERGAAILVLRAPQSSRQALDPDAVAGAVADCAARLVTECEIGLLVATGGDTALAILESLGSAVVKVRGEIQPGIVHGLLDTTHGPLNLVAKAGGFGDRQLFRTILNHFA